MIVVDTSAWVEFLRGTQSPVHRTLRTRVTESAELALTEVVVMELLAGARSDAEERQLRETIVSLPVLPLAGLGDYEAAALLFRACRFAGEPIRSLADCLIAIPAIEAGATLLHADADFERLARHSSLRLEPLDA